MFGLKSKYMDKQYQRNALVDMQEWSDKLFKSERSDEKLATMQSMVPLVDKAYNNKLTREDMIMVVALLKHSEYLLKEDKS